jgi:hypothetical protein
MAMRRPPFAEVSRRSVCQGQLVGGVLAETRAAGLGFDLSRS